MTTMRPRFFSLDGVDGVGKSTQLDLFCAWLSDRGHSVVRCRDPGGTKLGESLRKLLLEHSEIAIAARSEALLYMASRAQLVQEVIRPALRAGQFVVSDRFLLANVAYQGHAGCLDADQLWRIGEFATERLLPDFSILLDMDPERAGRRISREADRMEARGLDYLDKVRQGFLEEANRGASRITLVNADQEVTQVQDDIRAAAAAVLDES